MNTIYSMDKKHIILWLSSKNQMVKLTRRLVTKERVGSNVNVEVLARNKGFNSNKASYAQVKP